MRKTVVRIIITFVIAVSILQITGCTFIGLWVGAEKDSKKDVRTLKIPVFYLDSLNIGREIEIQLKDGSQITGKHGGYDIVWGDEYIKRYDEIRNRDAEEISLPTIGDAVTVIMNSPEKKSARLWFNGFDIDWSRNEVSSLMYSGGFNQLWRMKLDLSKIDSIYSEGGEALTTEQIRKVFKLDDVIQMKAVVVQMKKNDVSIPIDQIKTVTVLPEKRNSAFHGFLVGFLLDLATFGILYLMVLNMSIGMGTGWLS